MAKVTYGPIVTDARGSLGSVVFTRNRFGAMTRNRITPTYPATSPQTSTQYILTQVRNAWINTLTDAQREAWNNFATKHQFAKPINGPRALSGYALFTRCGYYTFLLTTGPFPNPPEDLSLNTGIAVELVTNTSSPQSLVFNITFTQPQGPNDWWYLLVTPPISPGRLAFRRYLKGLDYQQSAGSIDETSNWTGRMAASITPAPTLTSGMRIGWALKAANGLNGAYQTVAMGTSITS